MAQTVYQPQDPPPPDFSEGVIGLCAFYISPDQPFIWSDVEVFCWSVLPADDQQTFMEETAPTLPCAQFCAAYTAHYINQQHPPALSGVLIFPPVISLTGN